MNRVTRRNALKGTIAAGAAGGLALAGHASSNLVVEGGAVNGMLFKTYSQENIPSGGGTLQVEFGQPFHDGTLVAAVAGFHVSYEDTAAEKVGTVVADVRVESKNPAGGTAVVRYQCQLNDGTHASRGKMTILVLAAASRS